MKKILFTLGLIMVSHLFAQEPILKVGDHFPDVIIRNIINSPVKEIDLEKSKDKKLYILNFWGTWCSPCIPAMDTLAKLQKNNVGKIQVIGISNDSYERKLKYLLKKPSSLWLATDTSSMLYNMLGLSYVGQSVFIDASRKIITIVKTETINQKLIDRALNGDSIQSNAGINDAKVLTTGDPFGVDSLEDHGLVIRSHMNGYHGMRQIYLLSKLFKDRRISFFNCTATQLYMDAFQIKSPSQLIFDSSVSKKELNDYENKQMQYCVDILVSSSQKDSLYLALQKALNQNLSIKAREEKRIMEVYLLKRKDGMEWKLPLSNASEQSYGFNGKGFDGYKITLKKFAEEYLTNELRLPVIDATGLNGEYDIQTTVNLRNTDGIMQSIEALGLTVEKATSEVPVIVYYK